MASSTHSGFTLLELLIAVAVSGILVAIAVPSFESMLKNAQLSKAVSPAHAALFTARSEAVKSSSNVTVCPLASDESCGTDWSKGLLVFADSVRLASETIANRDATDEVISVSTQIPADISMSVFASDNRTASGEFVPNFISFNAHGQSDWQNGSLIFCDDRGAAHARTIHVLLTGSIRSGTSADGAPVDVFGRDVVCP